MLFIPLFYVAVGDLVELTPYKSLAQILLPDQEGHDVKVKIIGRRNAALKLPQGEFVVPETLEQRYLTSPYLESIFIHADRLKDHLVAIVIPCKPYFKSSEGIDVSVPLKDSDREKVATLIATDLKSISDRYMIPSYSRPQDFHIEFNLSSWDENGLITSNQKLSRPKLAAFYSKEIYVMYSNIHNRERYFPIFFNSRSTNLDFELQ